MKKDVEKILSIPEVKGVIDMWRDIPKPIENDEGDALNLWEIWNGVQEFTSKLVDLDPEYQRIINENFDELIS